MPPEMGKARKIANWNFFFNLSNETELSISFFLENIAIFKKMTI